MSRAALWLLLPVLLGAGPARASEAWVRACRPDFQAHCAELGAEATREDVRRCLEAADVTPTCRNALEAPPEVDTTCEEAIRSLCPRARDEDALKRCLRNRNDSLPPQCRRGPAARPTPRRGPFAPR